MKIERITDRREVITHYLAVECRKRPNLSDGLPRLAFDDANSVDRWLKKKRLKQGVVSGFRRWAYVRLSFEDLLQCSVVDTVSRGVPARRLGDLLEIGFLDGWEPITPDPIWHQAIRAGNPLPPAHALIIRPAVPSESARYYVEDGTGRATYLAARRPAAEVVAFAYVGFDPDPNSEWLTRHLDHGYFLRAAHRYRRIEDVFGRT